jgi:hypothetical protein
MRHQTAGLNDLHHKRRERRYAKRIPRALVRNRASAQIDRQSVTRLYLLNSLRAL